MEQEKHISVGLRHAVETIKEAILQGQYEASKGVNRIQLAVYFGIGKYISLNTRKGFWGTGALEAISDQLRRDLPGLRGFSATSLKKMRLFYDNWIMLDAKSSVETDDLKNSPIGEKVLAKSSVVTDEITKSNSSVATDELQAHENQINIYQSMHIPNVAEFPVEDFFKVPFTHHVEIFTGAKTTDARYYYIHRTAEEHLSVDALKKLLKDDAYGHREQMPSNFSQTIPNAVMMRDYSKPMGVATYKTADDMPEHIRKALPDAEELMKLM